MQCDKQEAIAHVGVSVSRLESVVAGQIRRKPWGKNGNRCVMMGATEELYQVCDWGSELHAMFYDDICMALHMTGLIEHARNGTDV